MCHEQPCRHLVHVRQLAFFNTISGVKSALRGVRCTEHERKRRLHFFISKEIWQAPVSCETVPLASAALRPPARPEGSSGQRNDKHSQNEQVRGWQVLHREPLSVLSQNPSINNAQLTRVHGTTGLNKGGKTSWVNLYLLWEGRRTRENTTRSIQSIDSSDGLRELTEGRFPASKSGWLYNNQFFITVTIGSADRKRAIVGTKIQYYRFDDLLEIRLLAKVHTKLSWDLQSDVDK